VSSMVSLGFEEARSRRIQSSSCGSPLANSWNRTQSLSISPAPAEIHPFFRKAMGLPGVLRDVGERTARTVDEERFLSRFGESLGVLGIPRGTGVRGRMSSCCASLVFCGCDGQANLIALFFAAPSTVASARMGLGGGSIASFSSGFGLAAQANEMHRFFACVDTSGPLFCNASLAVTAVTGTKPTLGKRGLGELVRAGVVNPVAQVRSAVEAKLVLLVTDRRL
jgi:hypothetical protein